MKKLILMSALSTLLISACTTQQIKSEKNTVENQKPQYWDELKQGVDIYFDKNSAEIEPKYDAYLLAASKILVNNPHVFLKVDGYTDSSGSNATNQSVSLDRANKVRSRLVMQYQVNPNQVIAAGIGSNSPIADNNTAEGRAKNRRVSLTLKMN